MTDSQPRLRPHGKSPRHVLCAPALPPKHLLHIPRQLLGPLIRGKVAPSLVPRLEHHGSQRPPPPQRQDQQLPREVAEPELHTGHVPGRPPPQVPAVLEQAPRLEIDTHTGGGSRARELVDGDPREDLVVGPGVGVGPVVQLLVDPREQPQGGVGEGEAERGRLGALLGAVAVSRDLELRRARQAGLLLLGVGEDGVEEVLERALEGWAAGHDGVDVRGQAVGWVLDCHEAGDEEAPVAALGHCRVHGEFAKPALEASRG